MTNKIVSYSVVQREFMESYAKFLDEAGAEEEENMKEPSHRMIGAVVLLTALAACALFWLGYQYAQYAVALTCQVV